MVGGEVVMALTGAGETVVDRTVDTQTIAAIPMDTIRVMVLTADTYPTAAVRMVGITITIPQQKDDRNIAVGM